MKIRDFLGMSMWKRHISRDLLLRHIVLFFVLMHSALFGTTTHFSRSTTKPVSNILLRNTYFYCPARSRNQKFISNPRDSSTLL